LCFCVCIEGIVDLQFTLGDRETKTFQVTQNQLKLAKLPYFERIPEDISGGLNLLIYLWKLEGSGKDCLTQLTIVEKPSYLSNEGMRSRQEQLSSSQCIRLIWHPHVHFEIQAFRSMKKGRADFAVQDLRVCTSHEETDQFYLDGYMLVKNLAEVGVPGIYLFSKMRKLESDENQLYKLNRIAAQDWCDERLLKTARAFLLSESDVFGLHRVFEAMLFGRNRDTIKVEELFIYISFPYNRLSRWVVAAINPQSRHDITFSEYVHLISYFVMLSARDLARFVFQHADEDSRGFLRRDQFTKLCHLLAEASAFNVKSWELQYEQFHDKKLKYQFVTHFEQFVKQNPGALWKPQELQQQFMEFNLGKRYWNNKLEQYRVIRENLGIKLV